MYIALYIQVRIKMKTNSITRKFGKLLRIDVMYDDHIESIKITGDFFIHPEDTLDKIVAELKGISLPIQADFVTRKINYIIHNNETEMIGITVDDIVTTLGEVLQ